MTSRTAVTGEAGVPHSNGVEVSVVMPCLNEALTLAKCIEAAKSAIANAGLNGEIIVADNGSSDGSPDIARTSGARVIAVAERGYGAALKAGCLAARGTFIVMGDADESYDFASVPAFVTKLLEGYDLVVGNRFAGGIDAGAMPWSHRYIGNPILSRLGRVFFRSNVRDFHCGMRGFTRAAFMRMNLISPGMEFASEMIAKASIHRLRIAEIPVALRRDGRDRPPHLRTWPDGWRHLRFMLLYTPRWLFMVPGGVLFGGGVLMALLLIPGARSIGPVGFDINTLLVAGFACVLGYQIIVFAVFTKIFAIREGLHPPDPTLNSLFRWIRLETGLLAGALASVAGVAILGVASIRWASAGFPQLDPRTTMRLVIPAVVLATLGVQTIFASFFLSILGMSPRSANLPSRLEDLQAAPPASDP